MTVTGTAPGAFTVTAADATVPAVTATPNEVTVTTPAAALAPSPVAAGTPVTLTLSGFTPGSTVDLTYPDGVSGPATAVIGTGGGATVPVTTTAGMTAGTSTVTATDAGSSAVTASAPLTVTTPAAAISPSQVAGGAPATVTLSGFTPGSTVDLAYPDGVSGPATATIGADGTATVLISTTAGIGAGGYTVTARDADTPDVTASAPLTVTTPAIVAIDGQALPVAPGTPAPGTATPVDGTGFTPDGSVTATLLTPAGGEAPTAPGPLGSATAGSNGTVSVPATLPVDVAPGDYQLCLTDTASGARTCTDITVPANPVVTPPPTDAIAGGTSPVDVAGLTPGGGVTTEIRDANGNVIPPPTTGTADGDGKYTADVAIPPGTPPGEYQVCAIDETTGAESCSTITIDPAPTTDPPTGNPTPGGEPVTAPGGGFTPGGEVTAEITLPDGSKVDVGSATADADGNAKVPVRIPDTVPPGEYPLCMVDETTGAPSDCTTITVIADSKVTAPPPDVDLGDSTPITAGLFKPGGQVTVQLCNAAGQPVPGVAPTTVTADPDGQVTTSVLVPDYLPEGQ